MFSLIDVKQLIQNNLINRITLYFYSVTLLNMIMKIVLSSMWRSSFLYNDGIFQNVFFMTEVTFHIFKNHFDDTIDIAIFKKHGFNYPIHIRIFKKDI